MVLASTAEKTLLPPFKILVFVILLKVIKYFIYYLKFSTIAIVLQLYDDDNVKVHFWAESRALKMACPPDTVVHFFQKPTQQISPKFI
mgnify:CR=1 FL=1